MTRIRKHSIYLIYLVVPWKIFLLSHSLQFNQGKSRSLTFAFTPKHTIISILTGRHCGFYKIIKTDKYHILLTRLVFLQEIMLI